MSVRTYFVNVAVGLDQFANSILGGEPDMTISYRAAQARANGKRWGCALCRILGMIQRDHCAKAIRDGNTRARLFLGDAG